MYVFVDMCLIIIDKILPVLTRVSIMEINKYFK